jgi:hypothetical protein
MSSGLLLVVLGVLTLLWLRFVLSHVMKRVPSALEKRGKSTEPFETMLESTGYRLTIGVMAIASAAAIVLGVVSLATE